MKLKKFTLKLFLTLSLLYTSCQTEDENAETDAEYIEYNIDSGEPVMIFEDINASFNPNGLQPWTNSLSPVLDIFTFTNNYNTCFRIQGFLNDSDYLGSYSYHDLFENETGFRMDDVDWINCPDVFYISTNININFNLSALGEVGEFIDISFSGSYEDYDGNPHIINGIVHVLRDE